MLVSILLTEKKNPGAKNEEGQQQFHVKNVLAIVRGNFILVEREWLIDKIGKKGA